MINTESIWDGILSRSEDLILGTYNKLTTDAKQYVIEHLNIMVSDEGWHPEQIRSARIALKIIETKGNNT